MLEAEYFPNLKGIMKCSKLKISKEKKIKQLKTELFEGGGGVLKEVIAVKRWRL